MKSQIFLVVVILALVLQGIAGAAIYRWVDQNGVVTFRDSPPAENPHGAQLVSSAGHPPITSSPASEESAAAVGPQVELYVTSWCPYCKQAEEFFRSQGIPFIAYDIEKDSAAARRKEEFAKGKGVPLALINGQKIYGYSAEAYREALKKKP